jgi:hypothetical protein
MGPYAKVGQSKLLRRLAWVAPLLAPRPQASALPGGAKCSGSSGGLLVIGLFRYPFLLAAKNRSRSSALMRAFCSLAIPW